MKITNIKILKGIGLMLLGMTIVPFLDIFAKLLSQEGYHVTQVTWTRFFFPCCLVVANDYVAKG